MPFRAARPGLLLALALGAVPLAGCQTTFDLVGVTVPLSAGEMRAFNGSYQGYIKQVAARGPGCPTEQGEKVIMVGDGVLWYAYSPVIYFTSPVQYDGTIDATSGTARMKGRVVGDQLDATVTSPNCETQISMHYIYNH